MTSFSNLLRKSNLVAHDLANGVCAVPKLLKSSGEYGLKKSVSKKFRDSYAHVQDMDKDGLLRVRDGSWTVLRYGILSQIASNMKSSPKENSIGRTGYSKSLEQLSKQEFATIRLDALNRREEFKKETQNIPMARKSTEKIYSFLGLSRAGNDYICDLDYLADKNISHSNLLVKGRILDKVPGGYAISVGGIVGFLPANVAKWSLIPGWNPDDRRKIYEFSIEDLKLSRDGKIMLRLTSNNRVASQKKQSEYFSNTQDELQSLLDDLLNTTDNGFDINQVK